MIIEMLPPFGRLPLFVQKVVLPPTPRADPPAGAPNGAPVTLGINGAMAGYAAEPAEGPLWNHFKRGTRHAFGWIPKVSYTSMAGGFNMFQT